jgi:phosphopantothenate---cysteine ligase (CTP)
MNLLVTAGNTQVFIDKVRCLTNIFTGRTGSAIALEAHRRGHRVTLLTSHPGSVQQSMSERWRMLPFQTFSDLSGLMERELPGNYDGIIHCAAVSDYTLGGVFAPASGTKFDNGDHTWHADSALPPALVDRAAGKVKSDEPELWLRLVRAPKLVDKIRTEWGYQGILVKFKLEVGLSEAQLMDVAEKSRVHSRANFMVANLLDEASGTASSWVYLGPSESGYQKIARTELPATLMASLENAGR